MTCQIAHIIFCKFSIEPLYDKVVTVVYSRVYLPVMQGQAPEIQRDSGAVTTRPRECQDTRTDPRQMATGAVQCGLHTTDSKRGADHG